MARCNHARLHRDLSRPVRDADAVKVVTFAVIAVYETVAATRIKTANRAEHA